MAWNVRRPAALLVTVVLAFTGAVLPLGAAQAEDAGPSVSMGESTGTGAIKGVVRSSDGPGLDDVSVTAWRLKKGEWLLAGSVDTRADGSYALTGLAPGTHRIRFQDLSAGHTEEYWDNARTIQEAKNIIVRAGRTVKRKGAVLARRARISGRVTDEWGAPLEQVWVTAYRWPRGGEEAETFTDAQGRYVLNGLRKGQYRLFFQAIGGHAHEYWKDSATLQDATNIRVRARATLKDRNIVMEDGGAISGRVTRKDGSALELVWVSLFRRTLTNKSWERVGSGLTFKDGRYYVANLKAGTYRIEFSGPTDYEETFWAGAGRTAGGETGTARIQAGEDFTIGLGERVEDVDVSLGAYPFKRALKEAASRVTVSRRPILGQTLEVYNQPNRLGGRKVRVKYQWFAGRTPIQGATKKKFRVTAARHRLVTGRRLFVEVKMTVLKVWKSPSRTVRLKLRKTRPVR